MDVKFGKPPEFFICFLRGESAVGIKPECDFRSLRTDVAQQVYLFIKFNSADFDFHTSAAVSQFTGYPFAHGFAVTHPYEAVDRDGFSTFGPGRG